MPARVRFRRLPGLQARITALGNAQAAVDDQAAADPSPAQGGPPGHVVKVVSMPGRAAAFSLADLPAASRQRAPTPSLRAHAHPGSSLYEKTFITYRAHPSRLSHHVNRNCGPYRGRQRGRNLPLSTILAREAYALHAPR